ncbi:MAG: DEAD/DEAH box helicase [Planctomycetota bacterium]|nr:DEAD/DEAH box helicase [Planctomycetota bacterium]
MSFDSFGLHASLLAGVRDLGFSVPSPIQSEAIPAGLAGRDVLACASTGSGKTAAFVLPILNRLIEQPAPGTRVLILTPTRELAMQIDGHFGALARHTRLRSAPVYGGVGMEPQRRALQRGIDAIVATPGRLLDHMRQPYARLKSVDMLVLDEADRMLDMGFLPDIKRILASLPAARQTFLFSATMPSEMERLGREILRDPVMINIRKQGQPAANVSQSVYTVAVTQKSHLLVALVRKESLRNALVFTRTKRRADRVAEYLVRYGVKAERIHGDRSQAQRTKALDGFKRGHFQVLVATDVAARGLDVVNLSHVINFDMPGSVEDYIHRIGRTARAQAKGEAFTFVAPEDEQDLRAIERRLAKKLPRAELPELPTLPAGFPPAPRRQAAPSRTPYSGNRGARRRTHGSRRRSESDVAYLTGAPYRGR